MTLVTSVPFLEKRIGSWDLVFKIVLSTHRTEFDMLHLLLVHLVHAFHAKDSWRNKRQHRWGGRGLQCAVIRAGSS